MELAHWLDWVSGTRRPVVVSRLTHQEAMHLLPIVCREGIRPPSFTHLRVIGIRPSTKSGVPED